MKSINASILLQFAITIISCVLIGVFGSLEMHYSNEEFKLRQEQLYRIDKAETRFKIQVQEWKNILIRGRNPIKFEKYKKQFMRSYNMVQRDLSILEKQLQDESVGAEITDLIKEHQRIQKQYLAALASFDGSQAGNTQYIDQLVAGIDRKVTKDFTNTGQKVLALSKSKQYEYSIFVLILFVSITIIIIILNLVVGLMIRRMVRNSTSTAIDMISKVKDGNFQEFTYDKQGEIGKILGLFDQLRVQFGELIVGIQEGARSSTKKSEILNDSSENLFDNAQNFVSMAEESSATVEEVSASMDKLGETANSITQSLFSLEKDSTDLSNLSREVGVAMDSLDKLAAESAQQIQTGETKINQSLEAMNKITAHAARIRDVVSIINEISDQTGLLALNASIEAARAGDAGRGFAVVAEEVSRLSDRTTKSVQEIEELIGATLESVESGNHEVKDSAAILRNIIKSISAMDSSTKHAADLSQSQSKSIVTVIEIINKLVQQTRLITTSIVEQKTAVHEIAATAQSISNGAQSITSSADALKEVSRELTNEAKTMMNQTDAFQV